MQAGNQVQVKEGDHAGAAGWVQSVDVKEETAMVKLDLMEEPLIFPFSNLTLLGA